MFRKLVFAMVLVATTAQAANVEFDFSITSCPDSVGNVSFSVPGITGTPKAVFNFNGPFRRSSELNVWPSVEDTSISVLNRLFQTGFGWATSSNFEDHQTATSWRPSSGTLQGAALSVIDDDWNASQNWGVAPNPAPGYARSNGAWSASTVVLNNYSGTSGNGGRLMPLIAWGGDSVKVKHIENITISSEGSWTTTAVGFESDLIIFLAGVGYCSTCDDDDLGINTYIRMCVGFATDSANQYCAFAMAADSASRKSVRTTSIMSDQHIAMFNANASPYYPFDTTVNVTFGAVTSNGFRIWLEEGASTNNDVGLSALCFKFGDGSSVELGSATYPTSTGIATVTTSDRPDLVLTMTTGAAAFNTVYGGSTKRGGFHWSMSAFTEDSVFGAYTIAYDTNATSYAVYNEVWGLISNTSANMLSLDYNRWVDSAQSIDSSLYWRAVPESFDATGFDLDYQVADTSAAQFIWLAFSDGVGGSAATPTRRLHILRGVH